MIVRTRFVRLGSAASGEWLRIGHAIDNTQLVNLFECPPVAVDALLYFWAGRNDAGRIDGPVRMAEIEAMLEALMRRLAEFAAESGHPLIQQ